MLGKKEKRHPSYSRGKTLRNVELVNPETKPQGLLGISAGDMNRAEEQKVP